MLANLIAQRIAGVFFKTRASVDKHAAERPAEEECRQKTGQRREWIPHPSRVSPGEDLSIKAFHFFNPFALKRQALCRAYSIDFHWLDKRKGFPKREGSIISGATSVYRQAQHHLDRIRMRSHVKSQRGTRPESPNNRYRSSGKAFH